LTLSPTLCSGFRAAFLEVFSFFSLGAPFKVGVLFSRSAPAHPTRTPCFLTVVLNLSPVFCLICAPPESILCEELITLLTGSTSIPHHARGPSTFASFMVRTFLSDLHSSYRPGLVFFPGTNHSVPDLFFLISLYPLTKHDLPIIFFPSTPFLILSSVQVFFPSTI